MPYVGIVRFWIPNHNLLALIEAESKPFIRTRLVLLIKNVCIYILHRVRNGLKCKLSSKKQIFVIILPDMSFCGMDILKQNKFKQAQCNFPHCFLDFEASVVVLVGKEFGGQRS